MANIPDSPSANPSLHQVRHVALDMDGTIYSGNTVFDCTQPFLSLMRQLGIGYTFLTNNSSKSAPEYIRHLRRMGIEAREDELYTSSMATIDYLRRQMREVARLYVLGTKGLRDEFEASGFVVVGNEADDEPQAVVVGFDTGLEYSRLCRAAYWIKKGKPFVATHPDYVCPTDQPTVLVDCGSVCAALEKATGRKPDVVLGKPDPKMLKGILQRHGLSPGQLAMVGDRLYTDMEMALRAGAFGVLVLTGETTIAEARARTPALDLIADDLADLGRRLAAVTKERT